MSAPSARNRRPWAFIVVDNKALLRQLADSLPYAQSAAAAPMAVVVCGVLTESQGATNAGWWVQDAAAASENLLLAAHAVGLGRLSGRACIPPRIACVPSATCWGFPAARAAKLIAEAGGKAPRIRPADADRPLTRRKLALLLEECLDPFARPVDLHGEYR